MKFCPTENFAQAPFEINRAWVLQVLLSQEHYSVITSIIFKYISLIK